MGKLVRGDREQGFRLQGWYGEGEALLRYRSMEMLVGMLVYKDPVAFDRIIKGGIGHQYCTVHN